MKHTLRVEISAGAIRHNIRVMREKIGPDVMFCSAVKSNAYGHGVDLVWPVVAEASDWLTVASAGEALDLRDLGYAGPLLMLFCARSCGVGTDGIELLAELIRRKVTLTVTDPADVELIKLAVASVTAPAAIHVEVDSGMTRSGVAPDHVLTLLDVIRETSEVRLDGLYTHLATADELDTAATHQQLDMFSEIVSISSIDSNVYLHCANSAAAMNFPSSRLDMVRMGLMIYGCRTAPHLAPELKLRPALRLVSRLMQIHEVPRGTRVGYGLTYTCQRPSRIGLVPGGYGDGYPRALSNCAVVGVGDTMVPVLGRVSMDQISIDLTDVPGAMVGDEVELISNKSDAPNNTENLAEAAGTIANEILTRMIPHRMERVLIPQHP